MLLKRIGKYKIVGELGEGGMGVVYQAKDPGIGRDVAIKVIQAKALGNTQVRKRFLREARSVGRLSHENITIIYELGEEDGQPYIVMEYLDGEDLDWILERSDILTLGQKLDIAVQICNGLHYAHEYDVIHRDIKPANIRLLRKGRVKIMDFGIARVQAETQRLTQTGAMLGTPRYMSPEQVKNEEVDLRTDIFSFGVLFYELLSGICPFDARSIAAIAFKIVHHVPEPLVFEPSKMSEALQPIVKKCIAKEREDRYQDFGEVLADLEPLVLWHSAMYGQTTFPTGPILSSLISLDTPPVPAPPSGPVASSLDETVMEPPDEVEPVQSPPAAPERSAPGSRSGAGTPVDLEAQEAEDDTVTIWEHPSPPPAPPPSPPARRSRLPYALGAVVVAVLLVASLFIVPGLFGPDEPAPDPSLAETPPPNTSGNDPEGGDPAAIPLTNDTTPVEGDGDNGEATPPPEAVPEGANPEPVITTGALVIESQPGGAQVLLDGQARGRTPLPLNDVPAGTHQVSLRLDGYDAVTQQVTITAQQEQRLNLTLTPEAAPTGILSITSQPSGARILVDGQDRGLTPGRLADVPIGRHTVVLQREGYQDHTETLTVAGGQTHTLNQALVPITGTLRLTVNPSGSLAVDGIATQQISGTADVPLRVGQRRVTVTNPDYGRWERTVNLTEDATQTITINFEQTVTVTVIAVDTEGNPVGGSDILVDGERVAPTPRRIDVRVGLHTIEVRQNGYALDGEAPTINFEQDFSEPLQITLRKIDP